MIEYDYRLVRDEGDGPETYAPKYSKTLDNLVCLEGPNSSGKSTLLHLLALGCYGLRTGVVNESLRTKMRALVEADHQTLEFHISITDREGTPALVMSKAADSQTITVRDGDGKPLSSERFNRDFRLIYDIPEDPVNRLPKLLDNIRDIQLNAGDRVRRLRDSCLRVLEEIEDARNPDKIAQREQEIRAVKRRKADDEATLSGLRDTLKEVSLFTALKFYTVHSERAAQLKKDLAQAKKAGAAQRKVKRGAEEELSELERAIATETTSLDDLYHEVSVFLRARFAKGKEKARLELWDEVDVRQEIATPDVRQGLRREGTHFLTVLQDQLEGLTRSTGLEQARMLRDLIDLLGRYEDSTVEIPGAGLSVKRFVALLQDELDQHSATVAKVDCVTNAVHQLEEILSKRAELVTKVARVRELAGESEGDGMVAEASAQYDVSSIESNLTQVEKRVEYYKRELEKLQVSERDVRGLYSDIVMSKALTELHPYTEKDLRDRISGLEEAIAQTASRLHKADGNVELLDKELRRLKRQEPHEYQEYAGRLQQLVEVLQGMLSRLDQYNQFVGALIAIQQNEKKPSQSDASLTRSSYYEHVSKYLGSRVGEIQYVDGRYSVSKIDLIRREIHTVEGKKVKLDDMGTGQGQSAYLTGLLGGQDGRRMIALLDEVAMMDSKSLGAVTNKLRELWEADRLLVGVVVEKADELDEKGIQ